MAGSNHQNKVFDGFNDGVNNVFREDSVPDSALRAAVNVDLLPSGKVRRRSGYLRRLALTDARSGAFHFGAIYLADQGNLVQVDLATFDSQILGSVSAHARLSFAPVNAALFVTDGVDSAFSISPSGDLHTWAPEHPSTQPQVQALSMGGLPAGQYQVAITFLRGREESGTGIAEVVDVPESGGIQLTDIPIPESVDITSIRIYVSNTSGEILYAAKDVSAGTTSTTIASLPAGKALETQFLEPLPPGHIVRKYNGRVYSAVDNVLFYSQAMRFGLCKPAFDYYEFDDRIDMVRPVEGGIYVAVGNRVHFFSGNDTENFERSLAHGHGVVEGTDLEAPAGMFSFENLKTGTVAVWWSKNGTMVIGFPNGQVSPVREGELSLPEFSRGDTMIREENGVRQLVSVLQNPKTPQSPLAARDKATVTVHRNGIEI